MGLILWTLVSLISISIIGNYPFLSLSFAAIGGMGIGLFLYHRSGMMTSGQSIQELPSSTVYSLSFLHYLFDYRSLLSVSLIFILLFSKRFPFIISLLSAIFLLILGFYQKRMNSSFNSPLDFPVLSLLVLSATVGLYVSPNFQLALSDVFTLAASIAAFYVILNQGERIKTIVLGLMVFGAMSTVGLLFVMQAPPVKLPLLDRVFLELPNILPRKIHPNYAGGVLILFFPLSIWAPFFYKRKSLWIASGAIFVGLLLTQCRGAIMGAGMALVLTLAVQFRWMRWASLLFIIGGGVFLLTIGKGFMLAPTELGNISSTWNGRMELYQRAVYIIQDFSFTGVGLHSFPIVVDLLYPLFLAGPNAHVPHAHNLFLQIGVDMGVPGFVAFWMLLGVWGSIVWESLKRTVSDLPMAVFRPLVLGVAGGMVAHLIYGLTDAIVFGEKAGIVFWMNLALSVSLWRLIRTEEALLNHE